MKADISLQQDIKRTLGQLDDIGTKVAPAATRAALNKAMDKAHTETIRDLMAAKGIKRKDLTARRGRGGRIQKIPATARKMRAKLWIGIKAALYVSSRARDIVKVLGNRRGRYTKGHGLAPPHSQPFAATMPSGHQGAFARERGSKRLPITAVARRGEQVDRQILLQPEAEQMGGQNMRKHATITFPNELRRQIKWRADKLRQRLSK